ncbi:MAG: Unknown protein, partial [uncultured Thiotrichaceae bacterium]
MSLFVSNIEGPATDAKASMQKRHTIKMMAVASIASLAMMGAVPNAMAEDEAPMSVNVKRL